jgi:hypothetical protein
LYFSHQPGLREFPISLDSPFTDTEIRRYLLDRHPHEDPEFGHLGRACLNPGEALKRFMHGEKSLNLVIRYQHAVRHLDPNRRIAAARCTLSFGVVDKNSSHHAARDGKKM